MKNIAILGSTGSIGVNALRVIDEMPGRFRVVALSANSNVELLARQVKRHRPERVSVFDAAAAKAFKARMNGAVRHLEPGVEGLCEIAASRDVDVVLLSLVGGVGFAPLLTALKAGKTVALANKEPMVMAGEQFMIEADRWGGRVLPVDSEPSAMFQCLESRKAPRGGLRGYGALVARVVLTASGGAFYRHAGKLDRVTPAQALAHPTWRMGKKITVDCATLMNKGFEAIEIKNLFGLELRQIEIVIHPQSIVHSAVEFTDGSILAQLGVPDMRLPIQYAMTWPDRTTRVIEPLDLVKSKALTFDAPDFRRFPCLALAHPTWKMGKKITIDCATLKNKGFEAIEIKNLFGLGLGQIEIVIHPQSIMHSAVEFTDGSILAQIGVPDMRQPIQNAMT
ncbi:MAG: 1-deoxy-D-xylulose-5-phosphate reductoisomerase, partial [Elusimicrobia bacterium]|nr:1-deoxy-D-xylulose-5-phosphate reductoisomerase [Elusimicrobiota bacterium]